MKRVSQGMLAAILGLLAVLGSPASPEGPLKASVLLSKGEAASSSSPFHVGGYHNNKVAMEQFIKDTLTSPSASAIRKGEDPDAKRDFLQIVTSKGYPCEQHFITTSDGYILGVFRIPYGRNTAVSKKGPVFLQHGLLDSSFTWIVNYPGESLPYILADNGYDVWMGNSRGSTYSTNHTTLKPNQHEFWDFSWDEMARYDLPAALGYVLKVTNYSKLPYIGHSQGTIQMFAALVSGSISPKLLTYYIGLGPVATVGHLNSLAMRLLADLDVADWIAFFGVNDFLPTFTGPAQWLFSDFCEVCGVCCADVIELICGFHQGAFNDSRMEVMVNHEPGGTSVKNVKHWTQGVYTDKFEMFDYGTIGNKEHYGTPVPPVYDLSLMPKDLPLAMFSGGKDTLADPTDVKQLIAKLPPGTYWKVIPHYAHLDFAWALDANQQIYNQILQLLANSTAL